MKKAFTLIELIGVILILGVIGLVVYPVVNKSIKQSKENALKETIEKLEHSGYLYSIKNNIGYSEVYKSLSLNDLKEKGIIENKDIINPVTNEEMTGCLIYRYMNHQYEFKYTEPCQTAPIIAINNKDGVFNELGWSTSSFYVSINSNTENYEYCVSDKECVPDTIVNNSSGEVYINNTGNNYVCVKTSNELGSSEVVCEQYKLDAQAPTLASTTIYFDKGDNRLTDLLDITSASGYKVSCDKEYVSELSIGSNTINCKITSNNGLSINQNINFITNTLKTADWTDTTFLGSNIAQSDVESIILLDNKNVPSEVKETVDVSEQQNRSILAWFTDSDNNGLYELYIGQNGGIVANTNSNFLFNKFVNVTSIDISKLDTSKVMYMRQLFNNMSSLTELDISNINTDKVVNMGSMFAGMTSLLSLDVSKFDTSNVTNMSEMFSGLKNIPALDVSNFNTSNVTDMRLMFNGMNSLTSLNVSNFNTSKVTNMSYMFNGLKNVSELNVSHFDTSKVTSLENTFSTMNKLTKLDVSNFDTSQVKNMWGTFQNCSNLKQLDVSGFDTSNVYSMAYMFRGLTSLDELDVSNFNTSKVTNMSNMFAGTALKTLDLSSFDTTLVTNMSYMFHNINNLIELDVSSFNTSNVTTMESMFASVHKLVELNISNFNTSNVTNMGGMFYGMLSLTNLDVSNFNTSQVTNMGKMFYQMSSLNSLNISSFDVLNVATYDNMFTYINTNPTITVKDTTVQTWITNRLTESETTANVVIAN